MRPAILPRTARTIALLAALMPAVFAGGQLPEGSSLSATIEPSCRQLYVNQVFELTLALDTVDVQVGNRIDLTGLPPTDRFELGDFHELPLQRRSEGSRTLTSRRFRCEARAVSPGTTTISPLLHVRIMQRRRLMIGSTWEEIPHDVSVRPIVLDVLPLPAEGRPDIFSGAIGQFSFQVHVSPLNVAAGDLITATMKISGKGYLDKIHPPCISSGPHFKVYDSKPVYTAGTEEKIFEQIIIPQTANATEIPQIPFSFFDPAKGSYETVVRGPFHVTFHDKTNVVVESYNPEPVPERKPSPEDRLQDTPLREHLKAYAWMIGALAAIILGSATVILRLTKKISVRTAAILLIVINITLAVSIFSAFTKADLSADPEAIMATPAAARIAPAYSADATFTVPQDSTVRVIDTYRDWVKISYSNKRGWIPQSTLSLSDGE